MPFNVTFPSKSQSSSVIHNVERRISKNNMQRKTEQTSPVKSVKSHPGVASSQTTALNKCLVLESNLGQGLWHYKIKNFVVQHPPLTDDGCFNSMLSSKIIEKINATFPNIKTAKRKWFSFRPVAGERLTWKVLLTESPR